ncbi:hypothetical protein BGW42_007997 [Actinomortierella wolfii]|nr:hypothetical protein BGW42_007997 [Actinomortierella wolfii]KAG0242145.1 hypothetical protein BGW41_004768 [Actinomortierella wolfii]
MSYNPYSSLIDSLNSESPVISSPEDYADELSLWTNAEFTFDIPPGMGIFENDSGMLKADSVPAVAEPAPATPTTTTSPTTTAPAVVSPALLSAAASAKAASTHQPMDQQHMMDYLHLPQDESRPLSLLERTRMRNPLQAAPAPQQVKLEDQVTAINAFHSLLAAYTAQQHQQQQSSQQSSTSNLPTLLPNLAPATAPTTPAAAKLLRQPMPQYKSPAILQAKKKIEPVVLPAPLSPSSPVSTPTSPATVNAVAIVTKDQQEKKKESAAAAAAADPDVSPEVLAKLAAEEDKRRRNTAASARFRQKKKLREQALEQTAREQTARAEALEIRVKELEMEVKWLRGLIVEKKSDLSLPTTTTTTEDETANKRIKLDVY